MTLRLVALMSVVLLLSLAAFGLMIGLYQDQVMAEVARTASEVGRAALRTFEYTVDRQDGPTPPRDELAWKSAPGSGDAGTGVEHEVVVQRIDGGASKASGQTPAPLDTRRATIVGGQGPMSAIVCTSDKGASAPLDCFRTEGDAMVEIQDRLLVDVDEVHAESDPAGGMVLKIRTFRPDSAPGQWVSAPADGPLHVGAHEMVFTRHDDIRLPIPVAEYETLFARLRERSLWLFLGVFALGSVLSAGLASRFTRPMRRLDAGIRRLSAGDLDVEVPARGNDEVARLGRAFNDMARSLRRNRQRAREMVRREKHSALGRLAAGVAHDVRNPLHSIGLTLQHLHEACRPETPERAADFDRSVEIIRGEIRRLDRIVGTFLGFARSEARPSGPVDLHELLTETERLVHKEAEWRYVDVKLDLERGLPAVHADGEAIRSSLLNLVLNSFEAMPRGGTLTLRLARNGNSALVEVADTGEGIPEEDQDRVFEFAFSTKERGSGLGLAMVHQCVVEDHGGRVTLDSRPGGGTRVRMFLPLQAAGHAEEVA